MKSEDKSDLFLETLEKVLQGDHLETKDLLELMKGLRAAFMQFSHADANRIAAAIVDDPRFPCMFLAGMIAAHEFIGFPAIVTKDVRGLRDLIGTQLLTLKLYSMNARAS